MIKMSNSIVEIYHQYDDAAAPEERVYIELVKGSVDPFTLSDAIGYILFKAYELEKEVSAKEMADILCCFYGFEKFEGKPVFSFSFDLYTVWESCCGRAKGVVDSGKELKTNMDSLEDYIKKLD